MFFFLNCSENSQRIAKGRARGPRWSHGAGCALRARPPAWRPRGARARSTPGARARRASALTPTTPHRPLLAAKAFDGAGAADTSVACVAHVHFDRRSSLASRYWDTRVTNCVRHDEWHADWSLFRNCLVTGAAIGCAGQECAARAAAGARTVRHAPRTRRAARRARAALRRRAASHATPRAPREWRRRTLPRPSASAAAAALGGRRRARPQRTHAVLEASATRRPDAPREPWRRRAPRQVRGGGHPR